jgi:hypothetical protein
LSGLLLSCLESAQAAKVVFSEIRKASGDVAFLKKQQEFHRRSSRRSV